MKVKFLAAACAAVLAAPVSADTLLTNGSFENPNIDSNWTVFKDGIPGWGVTNGAGIEIQTDSAVRGIDAQDGENYVELDSHNGRGGASDVTTNTTIGQTVELSYGKYELSFWFAPRTTRQDDNAINFSVTGGSDDSPIVLVNGTVDGPNAEFPRKEWRLVTAFFNVDTAGDYTVAFGAGGRDNSLGGLIDNVQLSAVPLPAGMVLMLTGLGGLAVARRRKS